MENRVKNLEIEVSYLKREIETLKMFILNKKGNVNIITTNNNMQYPEDMGMGMDDEFFRQN